jgi:polysaccharide biosynthesis/export protein
MKMSRRALNAWMLVVPLVAVTAAPPLYAQAGRGTKPATGTAKPAPAPATAEKPVKPGTVAPVAPQTAAPVPAQTTAAPVDPMAIPGPPVVVPKGASAPVAPSVTGQVTLAPDYVVGIGDVLGIVFWRQQDMSAEVVVRPDGRISIPLLNDIDVAGLTPEQLRQKLTTDAQKFVQDPNVTVVVKQINSRRVFITGQVSRPGPYSLTTSLNVLQLISLAGGLSEYADEKNILIMRTVKGKTTHFRFNYKDMINKKNLAQNIELKPDDTVIVP